MSGMFISLSASTYTINAVDANGCSILTSILITQPSALVISNITNTSPSCIPGNDATMTITGSGGTLSYQYSIGGPSQVSNVFANLGAGIYTVTMTDANGCTKTNVHAITAPGLPSLTLVSSQNVSCNGGSNGSINVSASGGTGSFTYLLQPGAISNSTGSFNTLPTANYTITATDNSGCSASITVVITQPTPLSWTVALSTNSTCNGSNNGTINVAATGGTGSLNYSLQPGATNNTTGNFTPLSPTTYTITASDANGCTVSTTLTISQPTPVNWTSVSHSNVSCNAGNNGTINLGANGGTGIISYLLFPSGTTNAIGIFSGLTANTYTINATDANGCSISTTVTITQPTPLIITSISTTIPTCIPGNDASMTIIASGGVLSYQYSIGGANQASGTFNNLGAGNYTITITDANGCTATSLQSIVTPAAPVITNLISTLAGCVPGNDGSITVSANGGTGAYTYQANGGGFQSSNSFTGLNAGSYTIIVKDASSCTGSGVVVIGTQVSPLITNANLTTASCIPGCDGSASISATGGSGTYSYSIDNIIFQTGSVFNGLCVSPYTVTVKDGNGCTATSVFTIAVSNGPTISASNVGNVLCNGGNTGSITVTATGGGGGIIYTLQPAGTTNSTGVFTSLSAANYTVVASDMNGCTVNTILQITEPSLLQFNAVSSTGTLCNSGNTGTLNAPVNGGTGTVSYSILPAGTFVPPSSFINLMGNTTYTVNATDANNCSVSTSIFIPQANLIGVNATSTNITCNGMNDGSIQASGGGGTGLLTYALTPGAIINNTGNFTGLAGNVYTVNVSDANGCTGVTTLTVTEPPAIQLTSLNTVDNSCHNINDGSISILCTGGTGILTYTLQPGGGSNTSGIFTGLSGNTYTILVSDSSACTFTTNTTVVNPPAIIFNSVINTNVLCNGDSNATISILASGGSGVLTYNIVPLASSNTNGQFNSLPANVYTLTVVDANNCSVNTSVTVLQPASLNAVVSGLQNVTCAGGNNGAFAITVSGGFPPFQYNAFPGSLSNSSGVFSNIATGIYTVEVTDSNGCSTLLAPFSITAPPAITWGAVSHQNIICNGNTTGSISVVATGGTGAITYSILPSAGSQVIPGIFDNLAAANYTILATDASGCTTSTSINITQPSAILFLQLDVRSPACHGQENGSIYALATGGVAPLGYQLNGGISVSNASYSNLIPGTYSLSVTDAAGCRKDTLIVLNNPSEITADIQISSVGCDDLQNGKIIVAGIGGTGLLTYYLSPGAHINQNGEFLNLAIGAYNLVIKDSMGCEFDTTLVVPLPLNPFAVNITKKDLGCTGTGNEGWAYANVTGGEAPYSYEWSTTPPEFNAGIYNLQFGLYTVKVADVNGCTAKDTVYIEPGNCCEQVFIPNAFSPNGDGVNDVFKMTTSAGIDLLQFAVYNRWGNKVWSSTDFRAAWDGTYNGKIQNMETYYYIFWYECLTDKQKYMMKGDVMLLR